MENGVRWAAKSRNSLAVFLIRIWGIRGASKMGKII